MKKHAVDANQSELVSFARKIGFSVAVTSEAGKGFPDLTLGKYGLTFLVEVKDGKKPPSARKLTEPQEQFHSSWRGHISIATCHDDIIDLYNYALSLARILNRDHGEVEIIKLQSDTTKSQ